MSASDDSTTESALAERPAPAASAEAPTPAEEETIRRFSQRGRLHQRMHANPMLSLVTKAAVTVVGSLVVLAGVVMLVTPGPGFVAIAVGLAILSTEWKWAERWLSAARRKLIEAKEQAEQMDPAVRRRRILLIGGALILMAVLGAWYVWTYDWPRLAIDAWDWVQSIAGGVPDLPGM